MYRKSVGARQHYQADAPTAKQGLLSMATIPCLLQKYCVCWLRESFESIVKECDRLHARVT